MCIPFGECPAEIVRGEYPDGVKYSQPGVSELVSASPG